MHVGLNLLFLLPEETGGRETHVVELLPRLREARPSLQVTAFVGREGEAIDGVDRLVRLPVSARSRLGWAVGESLLVAGAAHRAGVDLLHSPANFGPAVGGIARVLTVHDVGWHTEPGLVAGLTDRLVGTSARRAHRVITVSEASRDELVDALAVPAARVAVVPNGVDPPPASFGRQSDGSVLCVASDLPHKDLDLVVAAHASLPEPRPSLLLAGHGTERRGGLGRVSAAALEQLYGRAGVVVLASRYEGFGIPVLEAFARGVPVVCSDLRALREVAGDLATFAPPGDVAAFARSIQAVLASPPPAAPLRRRAAEFSWAAAATATLAVYDEAVAAATITR